MGNICLAEDDLYSLSREKCDLFCGLSIEESISNTDGLNRISRNKVLVITSYENFYNMNGRTPKKINLNLHSITKYLLRR